MSPREGENKLGLQASLSCPGVVALSGTVVVVVLFPHHGVAGRDVTVPIMSALLARRWFTNCPARRGLVVAFIIASCSPGGVVATVREQVAAPGSLAAFAGCDADGLDLRLRGRGL